MLESKMTIDYRDPPEMLMTLPYLFRFLFFHKVTYFFKKISVKNALALKQKYWQLNGTKQRREYWKRGWTFTKSQLVFGTKKRANLQKIHRLKFCPTIFSKVIFSLEESTCKVLNSYIYSYLTTTNSLKASFLFIPLIDILW